MTTESEVKKCEIVSESLLQQNSNPSVGPEFYKPFCLGIPDWCPCCIKMANQRKVKLPSLKRPCVGSSDRESHTKSNKAIDRAQVTKSLSNEEDSKKDRSRATPSRLSLL